MTTEQKIKRYHSEEILLILFICSTDLSNYSDGDLVNFAEAIEGRIEVLFEPDFLYSLKEHFQVTSDIIQDFENLKSFLTGLYASRWSQKMKDKRFWKNANVLGCDLLRKLNIEWKEPNEFLENHLNIDWT